MTLPSIEKSKPRKPYKLEIANELYKFAFQVKLQKFKEKHPTSSPEGILIETEIDHAYLQEWAVKMDVTEEWKKAQAN